MVTETRRDFLKQLWLGHLALGLGVLSCRTALGQPAEKARYVGIETNASSALSQASFYAPGGGRIGQVVLDFRAHGMCAYGRLLVVFPRRPGDRFSVIDQQSLEIVSVVTAPADRHFFGHGAFTLDGRYLLVTENDLESLQGSIGVYEMGHAPRRVGQFALPGPGPHEIARHPEKNLFHIALGGLETHPAYGRTPLNLHDFRSQIVMLDFDTGPIEPMGFWPGSEGVSLRHLAMDDKDRLYIGGQIKSRERAKGPNVVWVVEKGNAHQLELGDMMKGYVSSVAAHGSKALVSSKESGVALCLDGQDRIEQTALDGASAVALGPDLSVISGFTLLDINGLEIPVWDQCEFDNHGLALPNT